MNTELQAIAGFAQVNLLEQVVVTRNRQLPWWAPLACVGLVTSAAVGSGLQLNPLVDALKVRATATEAQVQEQTQRIEAATRLNKSGTAKQQAEALQAALTQQQERLLVLLGGTPASSTGAQPVAGRPATAQEFSALLEGLSRTRVDGLWLTQVRLDRRTQEVRLEGQARHAQLVSNYIDDLSRNPRFKGLVLSAVEVSRPTPRAAGAVEPPEPARFKLASAATAPSSVAHPMKLDAQSLQAAWLAPQPARTVGAVHCSPGGAAAAG